MVHFFTVNESRPFVLMHFYDLALIKKEKN